MLAEETGEYEFRVQTANAARLWVNDSSKPLIDAWVQSGDQTGAPRPRSGCWPAGSYPLRLEFFKSKEKTAAVTLQWQPPHRAVEVIPARNLHARAVPPLLVVQTPFPPDDSSVGYERGTSVSKAWDQATTYAAVEIASQRGRHLRGAGQVPAGRAGPRRRACGSSAAGSPSGPSAGR